MNVTAKRKALRIGEAKGLYFSKGELGFALGKKKKQQSSKVIKHWNKEPKKVVNFYH